MPSKLAAQVLVSAIALGAAVSPAMAQYPGQYPPPPSTYPGQYPPAIPTPGQYPPPPSTYPGQYPPPPSTYPVYPPVPGSMGTPPVLPTTATSFVCGQAGGSPATLVQVNGRVLPSPLIVWQTASNDMSPEQRCQMVSQRMTAVVAQNGGRLSNLLLTTGKVNGYSVICFVNSAESCNSSNVIMTLLRRENARNPGNVLARIVRFGQRGSGNNVVESGGEEEEIIPTAVSLEEAVNQLANESGAMPAAPNPGNYTPVPGTGTGGGPI